MDSLSKVGMCTICSWLCFSESSDAKCIRAERYTQMLACKMSSAELQ
jgi:hypothetical protein